MSSISPGGLPPRIYLPIGIVIALAFLAAMAYLLAVGFGVTGSVFGSGATSGTTAQPQSPGDTNNVQGGGPPPAIMAQVKTLMARIAAHPNDDVSLTQLGDMFLAAGKYEQAIPLYRRALKANPGNVAAQTGLQQATSGLTPSN